MHVNAWRVCTNGRVMCKLARTLIATVDEGVTLRPDSPGSERWRYWSHTEISLEVPIWRLSA